MITFSDSIPLILFFSLFFLSFSFLQTAIVYFINNFAKKHWEIIVDKLLIHIVHHRWIFRFFYVGTLTLLLYGLLAQTSLLEVLITGESLIRILAVVLAAEILLVYFLSKRHITITIQKRIHLYIYAVLSFLSFTGVMLMADQGYAVYEASVKSVIVEPIVENIEQGYEKKVEDQLFEVMRERVRKGDCPEYDYANSPVTGGLTQFVFFKEDPEFRLEDAPPAVEAGMPLAGKRCIHETTFILTPQGKWYQVLEQGY